MPGDLKKKPEETRLRFVVLFLFLGCVSIVLTSHILYHQHIGEVREVVFKQGERGGVSIVLTTHILYHQHIGEVREVALFKQEEFAKTERGYRLTAINSRF